MPLNKKYEIVFNLFVIFLSLNIKFSIGASTKSRFLNPPNNQNIRPANSRNVNPQINSRSINSQINSKSTDRFIRPKGLSTSGSCQCVFYTKDERWIPKYEVMELSNDLKLDCLDLQKARKECTTYCAHEISVLNSIYSSDPGILENYPPSQTLPCEPIPRETLSFSSVCGGSSILTSRESGPPICCDKTSRKIIWCGSNSLKPIESKPLHSNGAPATRENLFASRSLNLEKDPNDESQNMIDDSRVKVKDKKDSKIKTKTKTKPIVVPRNSTSWTKSVLNFFGYDSFGDAMRKVDIFSLPTKLQSAVKTYKDELAMGRCYMEFTTFKVFTKQENPFEGLLRNKREADLEPLSESDRALRSESLKKIIKGLVGILESSGMLESSGTARQYSGLLSSLLPVITKAVVGNQSGQTNGNSWGALLKMAAPLISQMMKRPGKVPPKRKESFSNVNSIESPSQDLPLSSMLFDLGSRLLADYLNPDRSKIRTTTQSPTTRRPTQVVNNAAAPSAFGQIAQLLFNTLMQPVPTRQTVKKRKPAPTPRPASAELNSGEVEDREEKRFINMLLELIRPIFISIVGSAPGESGVRSIRRISSLSTLGRVDNSQRETVESPLFCFKRYLVNKAWTVTENGVRTLVSTFSPEEKSRMMERMLD